MVMSRGRRSPAIEEGTPTMTTLVRPGPIDVHAHWLPAELFGLPPGSPLPPLHGRDGQLHLGDLPLSIETDAMTDPGRVLADTDAAGFGSRVLSAPHGGGCAPALVGRWQHGWEQRADVRSARTRSPRQGLTELWFDTLTHDAATLELLRAHAEPSHLMCGSDYPFDMGVARPLDLPREVGIDDEALERNALGFLGSRRPARPARRAAPARCPRDRSRGGRPTPSRRTACRRTCAAPRAGGRGRRSGRRPCRR
jgi:hypothetical protein